MNTKSVVKKLGLDEEGLNKIRQAVKNAESKTSGEIAVCLASESSDYSIWELAAGLTASMIVSCILLFFSSSVKTFIENRVWLYNDLYLPAFFVFTIFVLSLIFFAVCNIPFIDRIIIPKNFKKKNVTEKAFSLFAQTNVYCTQNHNGILIFVSYLEREVRIIADKGISEKISDDDFSKIADELSKDIQSKNGVDAFCNAIEKCGELLSKHYPIKKDDVNELPDGLLFV
ncbi:MAG: TPM domain-containing protein [Treponema sp.]|nr:TPM domain-containing protein [Candidatus Treponema merdequi]